jgi:hypothetical protein
MILNIISNANFPRQELNSTEKAISSQKLEDMAF